MQRAERHDGKMEVSGPYSIDQIQSLSSSCASSSTSRDVPSSSPKPSLRSLSSMFFEGKCHKRMEFVQLMGSQMDSNLGVWFMWEDGFGDKLDSGGRLVERYPCDAIYDRGHA